MKTKLVRPLLVENNSNSAIFWKHCKTNIVSLWKDYFSLDKNWYGFNLILISLEDEKIEVGDTFVEDTRNRIDENNGIPVWELHKCTSIVNGWIHGDNEEGVGYNPNWSRIVITTQDQLSPEYIQQFVEQYNNGKVEDIEIEMEGDYDPIYKGYYADSIRPKLTNGFITIVENKEPIIYTEEEIKVYLKKIVRSTYPLGEFNEDVSLFINDWFEQNKKK